LSHSPVNRTYYRVAEPLEGFSSKPSAEISAAPTRQRQRICRME
jgi:hypothetical protein